MGRGTQLTEFQVAQVHELHSAGLSLRKIAQTLGRSLSAVSNVVRLGDKYGKNHCGGRKSKLSAEEVQQIRDLAATGKKSIREIHREIGAPVSVGTVHSVLVAGRGDGEEKCPREEEEPGKIESFRCFFCLAGAPEDFQGAEGGTAGGKWDILLKYLLDTRGKTNEQLLEDVTHILEEGRRKPSLEHPDILPRVGACDPCKAAATHIEALHQQLEIIQMKIVQALRSFQGKVPQHFVNGTSNDQWGSSLLGPSGGASWMGGTLADVRGDFQRAVHEKGRQSVQVPCIILDKFAFIQKGDAPLAGEAAAVPVPVNVKTEVAIEDDFETFSHPGDEDMDPLDLEWDVSTEQNSTGPVASPGPLPKLRLKRKSEKGKEDTSCQPPAPCKIEVDASPPKRGRPTTASKKLGMLQTTCSKEKTGKRTPNRPRTTQYKKRQGATPKTGSKKTKRIRKHVVRRKLRCALCPYANKTPFLFEHHLRSHEAQLQAQADQPAPHNCDQCSKSFYCEQLYAFHGECHRTRVIVCDVCQGRVPYAEMEAHSRSHSSKIFSCIHCSYCCCTREKYLYHLKYHGTGRLECDLCSKPYRNKTKLVEHLYLSHGLGQRFVCEVEDCSKEFFDLTRFKFHQFLHTSPHRCLECNKRFPSSSDLKVHERAHRGERPYQCSECGATFRATSCLTRHRITVHGANKFKCEYCDKEYMCEGMLKVHLTTHEGTGIPCGTCDKMLGNKVLWRRHQVVHATELNFICEECGKGFTGPDGLKRHSAVHGGEKKHKCQYCGKAFLYGRYLVDHERIHTGERPFTCDLCGKGFNQRGSLNTHKRKAHPDYDGGGRGKAITEDSKPEVVPVIRNTTSLST